MAKNRPNLVIEDARLIFKNFGGKEGQYNRAGDRNFCVILPEDTAARLLEDGWNVRRLRARDEEEKGDPYLAVKVRFEPKPPKIHLIRLGRANALTEEDVNVLDWADIERADVIISPFDYDLTRSGGKKGISAYLKSLYATVEVDEFEERYLAPEDSAAASVGGCGNCDACDGSCHKENAD